VFRVSLEDMFWFMFWLIEFCVYIIQLYIILKNLYIFIEKKTFKLQIKKIMENYIFFIQFFSFLGTFKSVYLHGFDTIFLPSFHYYFFTGFVPKKYHVVDIFFLCVSIIQLDVIFTEKKWQCKFNLSFSSTFIIDKFIDSLLNYIN